MIERRAAIELRAAGGRKLVGYAAVFNSPSQDLGGFTEIVKPGAFARSLASNTSDPLALVQHVPHLVLARKGAGTLDLREDQRGLAFEIDLPETTAARDLLVSVQRGDIAGCSFGFTVPKGGDRWEVRGDKVVRELVDVDLIEITITPVPAYADTSVAVRAFQSRHVPYSRLRAAHRWLESV